MKKILRIIVCFILAAILIFIIMEIDIIRFGMKAKPKKSDCIIVLGCQVKGTYPSTFLKERLNEGIRLYKEGYGKYIIVSGGKGPGEDITESEAMKRYLLDKGIEESKIIMEDKSRNTMENLTFSKKVMEDKGFKNAVVVSNKYHLKRVSLMCEKLGLNTTYSGMFVTQYRYVEYEGYIREVPGVLKFLILKK